ncbi:hypothetical protein B6C98_09415 [Gilliamella apis]|uniref:hypothetical protein n=1 Tax=Gilliamella apis TaxID=1970738 RepID=UPI000A35586D|nr:hypothetical protein [Gilliamella apis]OTQ59738.1 hypothetical protein B6C98_09415 [Gilliamella apis]OTQ69551.1 hypothetical protein B6D10_03060 [Gilliamella apis]
MVFILTVVVLQSISFANYALTTKTTNIIYGSAPYLTFDGGRTRVTNTEALLGISLSDGRKFTPATNNSSLANPIVLPVAGQSFNDIGMLVPTNTDSIALSSLIGTPYNYWGDDDGDGQGVNGITATGRLYLSIADKDNNPVARNEVPTICKAPYKLTLSNGEGRLTTRYGVPNESRFSAGNATYYINPNISSPAICYARPNLSGRGLSAAIWNPDKGFLTQSVTPSSYGLNFPTTGAHNLFFDLDISGVSQALSWAPVSHGGITATMTDSTSTSVRVTLTGPFAPSSQWQVQYPRVARPPLPQVFKLVGRDSSGNAIVKYGFVLRKWFVNRSNYVSTGFKLSTWCISAAYALPRVRDLVNASCPWRVTKPLKCGDFVGVYSTSASPDNRSRRHIGAGFFSEWGRMDYYTGANFFRKVYLTKTISSSSDSANPNRVLAVKDNSTLVFDTSLESRTLGICVYPY